jgi:DedD protein
MASTKSTELSATEIELKRRGRRRLIGAATIGLLGIVFLPMIFDGEPKRSSSGSTLKKQEISVQVPAKEGLPPLQAPVSVPVTPVVTAPPAAERPKDTPRDPVKIVAEPATAKPEATPVPSKVDKSAPVTKAAVAVADAVKKGFAVQLGVFADAENAKQTIAKMKDAKLAVYSDSIPIKSGSATRVRVGPFATREKADSALAEIKLAGSDGKIVPLP